MTYLDLGAKPNHWYDKWGKTRASLAAVQEALYWLKSLGPSKTYGDLHSLRKWMELKVSFQNHGYTQLYLVFRSPKQKWVANEGEPPTRLWSLHFKEPFCVEVDIGGGQRWEKSPKNTMDFYGFRRHVRLHCGTIGSQTSASHLLASGLHVGGACVAGKTPGSRCLVSPKWRRQKKEEEKEVGKKRKERKKEGEEEK